MPLDEKTKQAFEMIEQGVKDFYDSDNFKNYLSFISKFHNYSFNNTVLILHQNPNASLVAGYRAWQANFHRQVNEGEKGMMILAPFISKVKREVERKDENGNILKDENGNTLYEEKTFDHTTFKPVTVFDVSQTKGEPIPKLISELKGTSNEALALIETIKAACEIPISFKDKNDDGNIARGAKGYFSPTTNEIVISNELDTIQMAKTLVHEYSHSLLHKHSEKNANQKEIEAESLAFVICNHFGIETSDYSFGYVASYAKKDINELKDILIGIQNNAHEMISKLDPIFDKQMEILNKNNPELQIGGDIEHSNYLKLHELVAPLLTGDALYMKFIASGMMDLNIEIIGENRIAMAHNYEMNGDLMADPDIELIFDNESQILVPQTYQQDNLQYYTTIEQNPSLKDELSNFMKEWLSNINASHYKIHTICTDTDRYCVDENPKELKEYCDSHNMIIHLPKNKEETR